MGSLLDNLRTSGRGGRPTGKGGSKRASRVKRGSRASVARRTGDRRRQDMPGIKHTIYDGSVAVDTTGVLDLRGYTGAYMSAASSVGDTTLNVDNGGGSTISHGLVAGDIIRKARTGEIIGKIKSTTTSALTLSNGAKVGMSNNDLIEKYPKFEIAAIAVTEAVTFVTGNLNLANATDISSDSLIPVTTKWTASALPDGQAWSANAASDFGAKSSSEGTGCVLTIPAGSTIEGRWKYVAMPSGDSCICYLKATPSVGI